MGWPKPYIRIYCVMEKKGMRAARTKSTVRSMRLSWKNSAKGIQRKMGNKMATRPSQNMSDFGLHVKE